MPTRRQEKLARIIKEAVSVAIRDRLNDPRIEGFISVTKVSVSADLRKADVYFSIFGTDEKGQRRTFAVLQHARGHLQTFVAEECESKFCPVLSLKIDEAFKKTLETMRLIDEVSRELHGELEMLDEDDEEDV